MIPQPPARSRALLSPVVLAFSWGVGCFLVAVISDILIVYRHMNGYLVLLDDLLLGLIMGWLVFHYEKRRTRYLRERLRTIADMNHHVRNALQVISLATYAQSDEGLERTVRESSQRIEWSLREILGTKTMV
jgi:hypothetical protein